MYDKLPPVSYTTFDTFQPLKMLEKRLATSSAHGSSEYNITGYDAVITRQSKGLINATGKLLYFFIARILHAKY